LPSAEAGK